MRAMVRVCTTAAVLAGGMMSAAAGALPAESPPVEIERPKAEDVRLEVDLSERTLYVYHAGSLMNTFPVAIGEPEHPTPRGSFTIDRIIWNPGWIPPEAEWAEGEDEKAPNDPDNPMVGAKLFFSYPDYYIHGTDAPETLGEAASHGCLRMRPADVIELAKFVQTQGGEARSEEWFDRVAADDSSDHEVTLSEPVPIDIRD